MKQREKEAVERMKKQLLRIGKGVSSEAQRLFDELSKTYSCRWNGKRIELQQLGVDISPPYTPADCKGIYLELFYLGFIKSEPCRRQRRDRLEPGETVGRLLYCLLPHRVLTTLAIG